MERQSDHVVLDGGAVIYVVDEWNGFVAVVLRDLAYHHGSWPHDLVGLAVIVADVIAGANADGVHVGEGGVVALKRKDIAEFLNVSGAYVGRVLAQLKSFELVRQTRAGYIPNAILRRDLERRGGLLDAPLEYLQ